MPSNPNQIIHTVKINLNIKLTFDLTKILPNSVISCFDYNERLILRPLFILFLNLTTYFVCTKFTCRIQSLTLKTKFL